MSAFTRNRRNLRRKRLSRIPRAPGHSTENTSIKAQTTHAMHEKALSNPMKTPEKTQSIDDVSSLKQIDKKLRTSNENAARQEELIANLITKIREMNQTITILHTKYESIFKTIEDDMSRLQEKMHNSQPLNFKNTKHRLEELKNYSSRETCGILNLPPPQASKTLETESTYRSWPILSNKGGSQISKVENASMASVSRGPPINRHMTPGSLAVTKMFPKPSTPTSIHVYNAEPQASNQGFAFGQMAPTNQQQQPGFSFPTNFPPASTLSSTNPFQIQNKAAGRTIKKAKRRKHHK